MSLRLFWGIYLINEKKILLLENINVERFFMSGYQPVGYEFASELTFPEPEGPVAGILNICSQFFGILITLTTAQLQNQFSDLLGNLVTKFKVFLEIKLLN